MQLMALRFPLPLEYDKSPEGHLITLGLRLLFYHCLSFMQKVKETHLKETNIVSLIKDTIYMVKYRKRLRTSAALNT